jgi:uncharacterized Zn-binding protein involved in type VI secretion
MHICPKVNPGPVPHVGGPIVLGSHNVLISNLPAARVGDTLICAGPPDKVVTGSSGVLINSKPTARLSDSSAHGGKIIIGCPTVLIGEGIGGTVGTTLGNPHAGLAAFKNVASTRSSGSLQQSFGNCGVESCRQILVAKGIHTQEIQLLREAIDNLHAEYDDIEPTESGGTSPLGRQLILEGKGVKNHFEDQTIENIAQCVSEGKGVITSHDAGVLWSDPSVAGGHAVTVTGVRYNARGKIESFIINDTGTGEGGVEVPYFRFKDSLRPNRAINVTDDPIW